MAVTECRLTPGVITGRLRSITERSTTIGLSQPMQTDQTDPIIQTGPLLQTGPTMSIEIAMHGAFLGRRAEAVLFIGQQAEALKEIHPLFEITGVNQTAGTTRIFRFARLCPCKSRASE